MDRSTKVDPKAVIRPVRRGAISLGEGTKVHAYALLDTHGGSITIGRYCSVNSFAVLYGHGGLTIGDDVRIAAHVVIVPGNHIFADPDMPIRKQGPTRRGIVIDDDVWIGSHAVVLDGVTVAKGCVIAAGAVVTRSTEAFGVYAGVPAARIGERGANRD